MFVRLTLQVIFFSGYLIVGFNFTLKFPLSPSTTYEIPLPTMGGVASMVCLFVLYSGYVYRLICWGFVVYEGVTIKFIEDLLWFYSYR
ncbi:hypothetical protein Hanom_Chr02g00121111 [Helianthus anomalus]